MRVLVFACALLLAAALSSACGGGNGGPAAEPKPIVSTLGPAQGVSIQQVDFYAPGGEQPGSTWGRLLVDPEVLSRKLDLRGGFVSVVTNKGWAVVNVPVPALGEPPHAIFFDLALVEPGAIKGTDVDITHSNVALRDVRPYLTEPIFHATDRWVSQAHGIGDWPDLEKVLPPQQPPYTFELANLPLFQLETFSHMQDVTNIQCALNQCFPMATANALQYLENEGVLGVPNNHGIGIGVAADPSFNTLVGQLDFHAGRSVVSRTNGSGVWFTDMIDGTFAYLKDAGLDGVLTFRHQDRGYTQLIPNGNYTAFSSTSQDDGASVSWDWIDDRITDGCGMTMVYVAHAVRITGSGKVLGRHWIRYSHDSSQLNDGTGLENVITYLSDSDGDGLLNMDGSSREIRWVWAACP